jgi:hypothetical protein
MISYYLKNFMMSNIVYKSTIYLDPTEISNVSITYSNAQHVYSDRCYSIS